MSCSCSLLLLQVRLCGSGRTIRELTLVDLLRDKLGVNSDRRTRDQLQRHKLTATTTRTGNPRRGKLFASVSEAISQLKSVGNWAWKPTSVCEAVSQLKLLQILYFFIKKSAGQQHTSRNVTTSRQ